MRNSKLEKCVNSQYIDADRDSFGQCVVGAASSVCPCMVYVDCQLYIDAFAV